MAIMLIHVIIYPSYLLIMLFGVLIPFLFHRIKKQFSRKVEFLFK